MDMLPLCYKAVIFTEPISTNQVAESFRRTDFNPALEAPSKWHDRKLHFRRNNYLLRLRPEYVNSGTSAESPIHETLLQHYAIAFGLPQLPTLAGQPQDDMVPGVAIYSCDTPLSCAHRLKTPEPYQMAQVVDLVIMLFAEQLPVGCQTTT